MPEQDDNTGKLDETHIVFDVVFVTHNQSAEIVEPGEQSLHFPTSFESTKRSTILRFVVRPASQSVRRDHLNAKPLENLRVEPITVVSLVTDQFLRNIGDEAWCLRRPGIARFILPPSDNSLENLLKCIAKTLGMKVTHSSEISHLKAKVECIIQEGRLFLVFDEGHFLIPQEFTASTSPRRLNWVRNEILGYHWPVGMIVTPQAYENSLNRFKKKTGYAVDQFESRDFA